MRIDLRKIKNHKNDLFLNKIYDYIIIGSGPAAITLYKKLIFKSKIKKNILIIEEGDFYKHKYKKVFSKNLKIKLKSRSFSVGGTTNIWSNVSSYFEDFEMKQRWDKNTNNLWPIKQNVLLKEYKKLNKEYKFFFNKLKKKKLNIPFEIRPFVASVKPLNFRSLINFKEIDLLYNCKIESIDETQNFVKAYSRNNKFKLNAKKIIICCGGIESVNLILNSLSQKKLKNIKNKKYVGKFFMDHPKFSLGYLKYPKTEIIKKLELKKSRNLVYFQGVSLRKELQFKNKLLNSYVRFEKSNSKIVKFLEILNIPILKKYLEKKSIFRVRLFCEMIPDVNNSIELKKGKTHINLKLNKIDYKTIELLSNNIKFFFSKKPDQEDKFNLKNINNRIEDASHHMGGLRFDQKNNSSIVDENLKINGLKNIYVCSSALFPTSGSVNPTMTICALSNRLGEYLNKKI